MQPQQRSRVPPERPPTDNGPAVQYSVDVMMRFLPDLIRHASAVPREDPLMVTLYGWAADWPLSSVGVPLDRPVDAAAVESIVSDRALLTLYVDRIVARKDLSRLSHPSVVEAIRRGDRDSCGPCARDPCGPACRRNLHLLAVE